MKTTTKLLITILVSCVISTVVTFAQTPQLQWIKQIGGGYDDYATSMTIDASGNVYTTGYFNGIVDFDPSNGIYNMTSIGNNNAYISKIDALGNLVWAKVIATHTFRSVPAIAVDKVGNVYVTGGFVGTFDFDQGVGESNMTASGGSDIFISKYNHDGNFVWAKRFGAQGEDYGNSITVDDSGNVYTTGIFYWTVDFDPGVDTYKLTKNFNDIFVLKLDANGNFVWVKQFNAGDQPTNSSGNSIAVDGSGNVYTTGAFAIIADFDPGVDTFIVRNSGGEGIYVSKLDASGNFVWAKTFDGSSSDNGTCIKVDASQNIYVTGTFSIYADFNPDTSTAVLYSSGSKDVFVLKLDSSSSFLWAKKMGGTQYDLGSSLAIDGAGNVYTAGLFSGIGDFDPGPGIYPLTSVGSSNTFPSNNGTTDAFISKLDANGNFVWAKQLGSAKSVCIASDIIGTISIAGTLNGIGDFDPGNGVKYLASEGETDIFIERIKQIPVGVDDVEALPFSISPNPSTNSLTINFGKQITNGRIKLINLMGQTILEKTDINGTSLSVDISSQPKGMYFVQVCNGTTTERLKLLKE